MSSGWPAVTVAPPLLLWAASLYKLPAVSRIGRQRALSAYWSGIAWLAVGMTLLVPAIAAGLDRLVHVPDLAWLVIYAAVLRSGFSASIALLHEAPGPDTHRVERHRQVACTALVTVLALLFVAARPAVETDDLVMTYGGTRLTGLLLTVFYTGLAFTCLDMAPRCWRAGGSVGGLLRLALRGTSLASCLSLVYLAYSQTIVVQLITGQATSVIGDPLAVTRTLLLVIVALIAVGTSAPDWGPRLHLDGAARALAHYRARRQLFRLWFDVTTAVPSVDVPSPAGRLRPRPSARWSQLLGPRRAAALSDALTLRDATFQLHRRVIDVTDGRLSLALFHDQAIVDDLLADLPAGAADQAAVEAARLAASVASKLANRSTRGPAHATADLASNSLDGWSLQDEVDHLARVARCYRRLEPAVRKRRDSAAPTDSPAASSHT